MSFARLESCPMLYRCLLARHSRRGRGIAGQHRPCGLAEFSRDIGAKRLSTWCCGVLQGRIRLHIMSKAGFSKIGWSTTAFLALLKSVGIGFLGPPFAFRRVSPACRVAGSLWHLWKNLLNHQTSKQVPRGPYIAPNRTPRSSLGDPKKSLWSHPKQEPSRSIVEPFCKSLVAGM